MKQQNAPLLKKIRAQVKLERIRFHVPAHGGGPGLPPGLRRILAGYAALDLTELPGLDDLHQPRGAIAAAERLAAELFGADGTYFLAGGASAGVAAMLLAACNPGDVVLVPRNAHGSVYHGLILSGAVPRYLPVAQSGTLPLNVTAAQVREGLAQNPGARAVLLTSPGYHGVCADLAEIGAMVRARGALLLLDEAHGAHLRFHHGLPSHPTEVSDLCVQSWHKTLGALTPGAVLHRYGNRSCPERLRLALQWVQTSSPPYPLLLSLDAVRRHMALRGRRAFGRVLWAARVIRRALDGYLPLLTREAVRDIGFDLDPTRLTVLCGEAGWCGLAAARSLQSAGVEAEMAFPDHFLLICGLGTGRREVFWTLRALRQLKPVAKTSPERLPALPVPRAAITPREAAFLPARRVVLAQAAGQVAAAPVVAYPPGIPVLAPGEMITGDICAYLQAARSAGVRWRGLDDAGRLLVCKGVNRSNE
jgi:arginine/lysine/ornithine decarboxylase